MSLKRYGMTLEMEEQEYKKLRVLIAANGYNSVPALIHDLIRKYIEDNYSKLFKE